MKKAEMEIERVEKTVEQYPDNLTLSFDQECQPHSTTGNPTHDAPAYWRKP